MIPTLRGTGTIIETGFSFATEVLFHFKYLVNFWFASVNLRKKWWEIADVWWHDRAVGRNASCPQLVSVAFVTTWWAGPVVDDQGNADQGEQHPQDQEKGGLEQHKGMGYFQRSQHLPHTPGEKIEMLFPLFLCPLVFGVCYNHCQTVRIIPRLYQGGRTQN